jgi:hypothetical protein
MDQGASHHAPLPGLLRCLGAVAVGGKGLGPLLFKHEEIAAGVKNRRGEPVIVEPASVGERFLQQSRGLIAVACGKGECSQAALHQGDLELCPGGLGKRERYLQLLCSQVAMAEGFQGLGQMGQGNALRLRLFGRGIALCRLPPAGRRRFEISALERL